MANEYIRLGHSVVGCGRRAATIEALNKEYAGTTSSFHVVDVSKEDEVAAFAREVRARHAGVDCLICNAGLGGAGKPAWEIPAGHIHKIVDVSLKGVMFTNNHIVPMMLQGITEKSPEDAPVKRVINISSGVGHTSNPYAADYCAVKFAVEGYSKCVAQGFKEAVKFAPHWRDRIICVPFAPGVVRTEMNRNPAIPTTDVWCKEAAPYILQIPASESGSSITMPGYYGEDYQATWVVPDGARMNSTWMLPMPPTSKLSQ